MFVLRARVRFLSLRGISVFRGGIRDKDGSMIVIHAKFCSHAHFSFFYPRKRTLCFLFLPPPTLQSALMTSQDANAHYEVVLCKCIQEMFAEFRSLSPFTAIFFT